MNSSFCIKKDKFSDSLFVYFECDYLGVVKKSEETQKFTVYPSWGAHSCDFLTLEEAITELMFHFHHSMKKTVGYC